MNREIKFRGKRPNSGKWIYGSLFIDGIFTYILNPNYFKSPECSCEVLPETVCQYTGLKDKNGMEIYEGDILKAKNGYICDVYYENDCFVVGNKETYYKSLSTYAFALEIIGNIYDIPQGGGIE